MIGRLRREFQAYYAGLWFKPKQSQWLIADAIDRLDADVAAIKEIVQEIALRVPSEFSADACNVLLKMWSNEVEELKAMLEEQQPAAPQPAAPAWLTNEERGAVSFAAASFRGHAIAGNLKEMADQLDALLSRAGSEQWLTEDERGALSRAFDLLCDDDGDNPLAGTVQALLARAGSPPVVEVPAMRQPGPMTIREKQIHVAYRAAMDKAGVKWNEVGRE